MKYNYYLNMKTFYCGGVCGCVCVCVCVCTYEIFPWPRTVIYLFIYLFMLSLFRVAPFSENTAFQRQGGPDIQNATT